VGPKTLRLAAEAGEIEAIHPLPNGPWIFSRAVLSTALTRAITERARQNSRHLAGSHPDQQSLFSFNDTDRWVFRCALVVPPPALDDDLGLARPGGNVTGLSNDPLATKLRCDLL